MQIERLVFGLLLLNCLFLGACSITSKDNTAIQAFVDEMAIKYQMDKQELNHIFAESEIKPDIIAKITKPSESKPWYKYEKIFLTQKRIQEGVKFWQDHAGVLAKVEQKFGVPPEMIVAILGVETYYGKNTGNYRVIDALTTLAFDYPPRSKFFRSELENFLMLCQQEKINPLQPLGSYAGAMGMPQFMPSSYLKYAIDFNKDNYRDIWHNFDDVIASVGNYFKEHGWKKGEKVALKIDENGHKTAKKPLSLKMYLRKGGLESANLKFQTPLLSNPKAGVIAFEQPDGEDLWAAFDNFYVIMRYNKSPLYALAVFQLSLAIANQRYPTLYEANHHNPVSVLINP